MTEESKRKVRRFTQSHGKGRARPRHAHRLPPLPGKLLAWPSWSLFRSSLSPTDKTRSDGRPAPGVPGSGEQIGYETPQVVHPEGSFSMGAPGAPLAPACPSRPQPLNLVQQHLVTAQQWPGPPEAARAPGQASP